MERKCIKVIKPSVNLPLIFKKSIVGYPYIEQTGRL